VRQADAAELAMATKLASKPELYTSDFYVWAEEQAALLRAKRFDALDLDHLIEEVEGLADAKRSAVLNNARVVMEHLLKLEYSRATDPRNKWRATVREHRNRLEADLTPRLLQVLDDELVRWYGLARKSAFESMLDHGEHAVADALPETCPYTREQVTGDWLP
jgi:Domain of unknown function DUF29